MTYFGFKNHWDLFGILTSHINFHDFYFLTITMIFDISYNILCEFAAFILL